MDGPDICTICRYTLSRPEINFVDPESPLSHWSLLHKSAQALYVSSKHCSVCALIWGQLSPSQQQVWLDSDADAGQFEPEATITSLHQYLDLCAGIDGNKSPPGLKRGILYGLLSGTRRRGAYLAFRNAALPQHQQIPNVAYLTGQCFRNASQLDTIGDPIMNSVPWTPPGPGKVAFTTGRPYQLESVHAHRPEVIRGDSTSSDHTMHWIKTWLFVCLDQHKECGALENSNFMPTRVIDAGTSDDSPRLCYGQNVVPGSRYMTLSHCWGKSVPLKLKRANEKSLLRAIPLNEISRTFSDAIDITRRLGFRYLWIDSLCIIQDIERDWFRESALMGQYYENSVLNIAASSAVDGTRGCYSPRNSFHLSSQNILFRSPLDDDLDCLYTDVNQTWRQSVENAPLNKRSWVFQERLLSRRAAHFAQGQVFWGCNKILASEAFPLGLPGLLSSFSRVDKRYNFDGLEQYDWKGVASIWQTLVTGYVVTELTYQSDKLVAFGGIAKRFQSIFTRLDSTNNVAKYYAGLWSLHFEYQLLWFVDLSKEGSPVPPVTAQYVAPSWSWASSNSPVSWDYLLDIANLGADVLVSIGNISTTPDPKHGDPFLTLTAGYIELQGRLWLLSASSPTGDAHRLDINVDISWHSFFDESFGAISDDFYLLPIVGNELLEGSDIRCLMLRYSGTSANEFIRIGLCRITYRSTEENESTLRSRELEDWIQLLEGVTSPVQPAKHLYGEYFCTNTGRYEGSLTAQFYIRIV